MSSTGRRRNDRKDKSGWWRCEAGRRRHGLWMMVVKTKDYPTSVIQMSPFRWITWQECYTDLGVLYWQLNPKDYENDEELKKIREARGYNYMDLLDLCPEKVANYEEKLKNFYTEHIHADEEIRYCLEGSGYFDIRDKGDRWIRIWIRAGDLIVLPAGIYHRFTLDTSNYVKLMRLFVGEPVWTPYNRPQEDHPARTKYVKSLAEKVGTALEAY
ncbi:hypothetical protein Tsubulata_019596 [Turnera subulata]|uniref:Acireductone dioxygenase n=1 Tax=Turnera subulata TaxID=218843 RepID=A0A9Q0FD85_9ROSI|nr:hypothetical protein Tsubulata_019596 [Turnera subulata]